MRRCEMTAIVRLVMLKINTNKIYEVTSANIHYSLKTLIINMNMNG